ncbi:MAG TPA: OmpA family protein [bacterium]|nr:OmpA family protein [bacterium]
MFFSFKSNKSKVILWLIAACLFLPGALHAAASFDSISFKPATDQGFYLTTQQSQTLGQWGYAAGLLAEFSNDSVIARTSTGARINDVVEKEITLHAGGALGLFNWLNAGVLVEFVPFQEFNSIGTNIGDNGARMGDIRVDLKGRILDNDKYPVGIALVPFVTLPTGSDSHFTGNGKVTGGGVLVIDTPRIRDKFSAALNVGAQIRSGAALTSGTSVDDQFLVGAGVNYAVHPKVQLIADVSGWTPFDNFWKNNIRNLEGNGAVRWLFARHWAATVGGGTGILDAIGAPDYRVFASIAYRHPPEEHVEAPKEEVIRTNKIHFEFDKAVIKPSSYPILDNIVALLKSRDDVEAVRVEGHTDSKGSDEYNLSLSERRSAAVMEYLVSHGVPRSKLSSVGKGEREPIAPNDINGKDNPAGRAENRRVEFHLSIRPGSKVKVLKEEQEAPTYIDGSSEPAPSRKKAR